MRQYVILASDEHYIKNVFASDDNAEKKFSQLIMLRCIPNEVFDLSRVFNRPPRNGPKYIVDAGQR